MCAKKIEPEIDVYLSRRFEKKFNALNQQEREAIDEQIELIIESPEMGEQKKGGLAYLCVHKFRMSHQQYLLGYRWVEQKLELYMSSIGSHENFYDEQKQHRKADLKIIC